MAERAGLETLFDPRSVAVVGASDDPVKWGHWIALRAQRGAHRRAVHFVNRRGGTVLGRPAHRALAELPDAIDLAVLSVPAAALEQSVADAVAAGARVIVAISGSERDGDAGGARDAAAAAIARAGGARLLGPNCLGVFDAGAELELVSEDLPRGAIGFISQSGNLALEIGAKAARVGLGFSRFVSLGNQADIEAAELVGALAGHPETRAIAVYAEDFRDGRAFAAAAGHAAAAGKPVLLLAIEHTEATARAVQSHTGALATDSATIDAACRAAGIERVRSPQELVDVVAALLSAPAASRAACGGRRRRRRPRRRCRRACARRRARRPGAERRARRARPGDCSRRRPPWPTRSTLPAAASRTCPASAGSSTPSWGPPRSTPCC